MIEETILTYLNSELTVPVYMEEPKKNPPEVYVVIEKTGSGKTNHIYSSTFALKSYAKSLYEAARLNESVKKTMDNAITLGDICSSRLNSDYNFTDTTTKTYRYQAVYDLIHY